MKFSIYIKNHNLKKIENTISMLLENYSQKSMEAGLDEAGRGCGSGPVVAAAVILPNGFTHPKLKDSKKMTEKSKREVFDYIKDNAISWSVGIASPKEIDEINILQATMLAMHRAIDGLNVSPDYLIIDGNYFNKYKDIEYSTIVKGDGKYMSIAAASVLAKVTRDDIMIELSKQYPNYDWENNMGYLTKKHLQGIKEFGTCEHHRMSFSFRLD
jgi:ribonuclease HII